MSGRRGLESGLAHLALQRVTPNYSALPLSVRSVKNSVVRFLEVPKPLQATQPTPINAKHYKTDGFLMIMERNVNETSFFIDRIKVGRI